MPTQIPFTIVDLATVSIWADELLSTVFHVHVELRFGLERTIAARVWAEESQLDFNRLKHRLWNNRRSLEVT